MTLSDTQRNLVDVARAHGGTVERWPGGFWTYPGCAISHYTNGSAVPAKFWTAHTVNALLARGVLQVTERKQVKDGAAFAVRCILTHRCVL